MRAYRKGSDTMNINDRRIIDTLLPQVREKALTLFERRPDIMPTSGLRTFEEQARIYAQGRTDPGETITQAKPGMSWHNWGRAFDFCFRKGDAFGENQPWEEVGREGEKLGLSWGGRWAKFKDRPHFQLEGLIPLRTRCVIYNWGPITTSPKFDAEALGPIQGLLEKAGVYDGKIDGIFGPKTGQALIQAIGKDFIVVDDIEALEAFFMKKASVSKESK